MKITYPYEIEINSREEAMDYLRHQCDKCPFYSANWDCSGAKVAKCMESLKLVRDEFKKPDYEKLEKEGRLIILPVPIDSKVYEIVTGYSFGEIGDKSKPWYWIRETTFDLDNYYWFGDTVFATKEEAEKRVDELQK